MKPACATFSPGGGLQCLRTPATRYRVASISKTFAALAVWRLANDKRLYHVTESGIVVIEGRRSSVDISTMQL